MKTKDKVKEYKSSKKVSLKASKLQSNKLRVSTRIKLRQLAPSPTSYKSLRYQPVTDKIKSINRVEDLLASSVFDSLHVFKQENYIWHVECSHASCLDDFSKSWAFNLCKANVEKMYEHTVGWNEEKKFKEMTEELARYIFIRNGNTNEPVAFSHFRFDMDYGEEVLYCYELHVSPAFRGKGLGSFLLRLLELVAFTYDMSKVILTVFKSNVDAVRFYRRANYDIDHTSPENSSYIILSKYKEDWKSCPEVS